MNKKLTDIISIIDNNRYNNYEYLQKNTKIILDSSIVKHRFTKLFNDLLQLCKNVKRYKPSITEPVIEEKKTVSKIEHPLKSTPVIGKIIRKIPNFTQNALFNVLMKKYDLYMIKVRKVRYDPYSEVFMKAVDKLYCVLPQEESINYLKKVKYEVVEEFNKKNIYKMFNYSAKHFKKSELDDIFGNNKPVRLSMLKVFADVFNCNLIYLENTTIKFITKFVDNLAIVVLTEDRDNIYCLRTKGVNSYIRSEILKESLGVNIKLYAEQLTKTPLDKLQNLSRMKNIDHKKQGKTKKINKTRQELIDEICLS